MSRSKQFTHTEIETAKFDDDPIRITFIWRVSNKVGFDKVTLDVPEGIVEQTNNALEAVNRCFQKANLGIGDMHYMNVMLSTMHDKAIVGECIRKKLAACAKVRWSPEGIKNLTGVKFHKANFADKSIKVMINADEYHGR